MECKRWSVVEKVVGDMFSNSAKHIGPIIKKIAIYQAPGRYFFKPEVDAERFLKPAPERERRIIFLKKICALIEMIGSVFTENFLALTFVAPNYSPKDHGQPSSALEKFDQLAVTGRHLQPVLPAKVDSSELEKGAVSNSRAQEASDANEKIDILHN
ncbi:hypothetical protein BC332_06827 [Capsicum chinense]|nr:hypothetical protein BC332_06827 [Capsicum chinense]